MDIFARFKQALKIREVIVDNNVFQLHYRVTALMLLCCAGLVASKQHFGDPIDCITRDDVPNKIMDTYCWIHSTFTLAVACNKTVGVEVAHPCVDKSNFSHQEERVYHTYYQWVYFVLFFQAAFFYAPHFFWKSCEARLLRQLTSDLRDPLFKKDEKKDKAKSVVRYLRRHRSFRQHTSDLGYAVVEKDEQIEQPNSWAAGRCKEQRHYSLHQRYYYCFTLFEVANLLNVLIQIYVVDRFLGGSFTTYGLEVIQYAQLDQEVRVDPMVRVFPRMTKCTFSRFGSSGDVQIHDALCILPLNIINEKIYIIMWFWFVFLAFVTGCWLVYRALTFFRSDLRFEVLKRRASLAQSSHLRLVLKKANPGDWFLLSMICKNMDSQWFNYIVSRWALEIKREAKGRQQCNASGSGNQNKNKLSRKQACDQDDDTKELILASQGEESRDYAQPHIYSDVIDDEIDKLSSDPDQDDTDRDQLADVKVNEPKSHFLSLPDLGSATFCRVN